MMNSKYRIVIIESPYANWGELGVPDFFSKIVSLRKAGFGGVYPPEVLPVDTADFIGNHFIICEETPENLEPVLIYKSISSQRCRAHNLTFPLIGLAQAAKADFPFRVLSELLVEYQNRGHDPFYNGGWTIKPEIRKDREKVGILKSIMMGVEVLFHQELSHDFSKTVVFSGGAIRFKVPEYLASYGFKPITFEGNPLDPIHVVHLGGEPASFLYLTEFSPEAKQAAESIKYLWSNRIHFRHSLEENKIQRAA